MILLLLILTTVYLGFTAMLVFGIRRSVQRDTVDTAYRPFVSVVVPARNEEDGIVACLESLRNQTYPTERYEIILVDDHSSDRTGELAERFRTTCPNLRIVLSNENASLAGKTNALAQGIDYARGELILMTDADCSVKPTWVEYVAARFADPQLGVLGAMTVPKSNSYFKGIQSLDWMYLLGVSCATIGLKMPVSIIGNNFSVRRAAYDDVGGFRGIKKSVVEDFQLFQTIVRKKSYRHHFALDGRITNQTHAWESFGEIFRQKHHWATGGLDLDLVGHTVFGYTLMAAGFAAHLAILLNCFWGNLLPACAAFVLKSAGDWYYLNKVAHHIGQRDQLKYYWCFAFYYLLWVVILPLFVVHSRKVTWKGRVYT
ncbi:MAG: glycosyltransferase [Ignavibacteriales bacterium]|nr:glycosyltransferase [Ignavibacteriales bacterium]